jgi:hypothetical protein
VEDGTILRNRMDQQDRRVGERDGDQQSRCHGPARAGHRLPLTAGTPCGQRPSPRRARRPAWCWP